MRDSPNPQPCSLVLNPGLNIFFQFFLDIPLPESSITIIILFFSNLDFKDIMPSLSNASIAFLTTFSFAHEIYIPFALIFKSDSN